MVAAGTLSKRPQERRCATVAFCAPPSPPTRCELATCENRRVLWGLPHSGFDVRVPAGGLPHERLHTALYCSRAWWDPENWILVACVRGGPGAPPPSRYSSSRHAAFALAQLGFEEGGTEHVEGYYQWVPLVVYSHVQLTERMPSLRDPPAPVPSHPESFGLCH